VILDEGYLDAYRSLHPDRAGLTFPTWDPHVRLDFLFVPQRLAPALQACEVMIDVPGVREASDHLPLLSVLDTSAVARVAAADEGGKVASIAAGVAADEITP
jgi:exonuclease III